MKYTYTPKGVCPALIEFELDGDVVHNVKYTGGCHGNTQAVSALVEGMTVDQVAERIEGIECGFKGTSCGDQLVRGLKEAMAKGE